MSNELKIESGKYYRMRNGERVYVALTNKPGSHPVIGWSDEGDLYVWQLSGVFSNHQPGFTNIVGEWVEPERIPWEHLPAWCRWWIKMPKGTEWGAEKQPVHDGYSWIINDYDDGCVRLPKRLHSNYTGDWRTSLRERPEAVEFRKVEDKR